MPRRLLAVIACLVACIGLARADVATLERGNGPEPDTLDAHRAQTIAAFNVLRDLYEGLVAEDAEGRLVPGMAERWETSDDGLTWTFHLRDGLTWSDGKPLTADHVAASLRRAVDPATLAPYANLLSPIVGADAVLAGRARPDTLGIRTLDARTVVIELARPAPLLPLLALPIAFPVWLPAIAEHGAQHTRPGRLISNGPYRLTDWQPQAAITLERNPHFHAATDVAIERVRFHATEDAASEAKRFLAGDLDITETVPPGRIDLLRERYGEQLRVAPYLGTFYFGFNLRRAPFRDAPALREALVLAIDRDILTRHVTAMGEAPAWTLVPPGTASHAAWQPEWATWTQERREARARERYAAAGHDRERPLEIELRYNTSLQNRRLALAIAQMWRQVLGVRTRLINEEWKVFVVNRRQGALTQVYRGSWIADYDDAASFLGTFVSNQPLNTAGWSDPEYDRLVAAAQASPDPVERTRLNGEAERRLVAAHVILPIYHYTSRHLVADRVVGWRANPMDRHPTRFLRLR
jgi:oligopeptide transport system substrate-binding protein